MVTAAATSDFVPSRQCARDGPNKSRIESFKLGARPNAVQLIKVREGSTLQHGAKIPPTHCPSTTTLPEYATDL